jgi:predicted transcriptional regulator
MQEISQLIRNKVITKMDAVIYYHLENTNNYHNVEQLVFLLGFARDKIYLSLKKLTELGLVEKTEEHPAMYYIENGKDN